MSVASVHSRAQELHACLPLACCESSLLAAHHANPQVGPFYNQLVVRLLRNKEPKLQTGCPPEYKTRKGMNVV